MDTPKRQFILVLNGPLTAGKSSLTKLVLQQEGVFHGSYDNIKWLISNYHSTDYEERQVAKAITYATIEAAANAGMSVVVDGGFHDYRERYRELAEKNNAIYLSINLEAPTEVLEERFLARIENGKKNNQKKIACTTLDGFHSRVAWYHEKNKDPDAETFDTSVTSVEEVWEEVQKKF